jgi:DNA-binding CsgD family transcriptional regulator/predicted enzyme related to lactoylglutathione lyase
MTKANRRGRPPHDDILTPAEWRTAHAVRHGMSNREIARRRGVSADAVKFHVGNVLAKLGIGNRRALRQWIGAPRGSALARKEKTVGVSSKLGPIGQISRSVADIEKAQAWYAQSLGLQHPYTFGTLAFFDCAGTRLMLTQEGPASKPESILYLRVEDIEVAHRDLLARGVEFINAPHMIHKHADGTEEWMAFFKDPEGRPLAIMSQAGPA